MKIFETQMPSIPKVFSLFSSLSYLQIIAASREQKNFLGAWEMSNKCFG
jgi:hypothetical protein